MEGASVAGKKVLLVHEDASLVEQIRQQLQAAGSGIEVMSALSAPRAMGMVDSQHPDVIVVDGELEGMDGYSFTEQIKGNGGSEAKVIILSLQPSESSALKARQAGAVAHMPASGPVGTITEKILMLTGAAGPADAIPAAQAPAAAAGAETAEAGDDAVRPVRASAGAPEQPQAPSGYGIPGPPPNVPDSALPRAAGGVTAADADAPVVSPAPAPVPISAPSVTEPAGPAPEGRLGAEPPKQTDAPHIDDLLRLMIDRGGSDLHITVGSPPGIRLRGEIVPVENTRALTQRDTMEMILNLLSEEQRKRFETELELDFAYSIPGVSRFRANVFQQRNSMGAVFRVIPLRIPTLEELGLPKVCRYLAERPRGLVLVTGPTGSGKSTTLAAMIDHINETRSVHVITLEDPIEFMHKNKMSYVNQREVGEDTHSFASALKRVLRQDPDVILVGEMRDLETISAAITAAETGHLVLATLHTTGGPATVDRIIDVFPPHQQQQVRMQLSGTLEGVLSQVLLRSTDGRSRVLAMEIMLGIPAIQNLIREGKTHQMSTIIQGGASLGMQTLDQHLKILLQGGKVTFEEAISKAMNPRELAAMVGRKI